MLPCVELAAKPDAEVQAARVARDVVGQRRDVGFDVRRVDADVDEYLGRGFAARDPLRRRPPRGRVTRKPQQSESVH